MSAQNRTTALRSSILPPVLTMLAVGLYTINKRPFWLDESFSWGIVAQPSWGDFWAATDYTAGNMFLYHLMLRPWAFISEAEWWLRLPSLVAGIVTIWAVERIGTRLLSSQAGIAAAWIAATSVPLTFYSVEARSYALTGMFSALAWLALTVAIERDKAVLWILTGLAACAASLSHAIAILSYPAMAAAIALPDLKRFRYYVPRVAAIAVLAIPPVALATFTQYHRSGFPPPLSASTIARGARFLSGDHGVFTRDMIGFGISIVMVGILAAGLWQLVAKRAWGSRSETTLSSWLIVVPVTITVVSLVEPLMWHRYMIAALPATFLVAAAATNSRLGRAAVAVLCVASVVRSLLIADIGSGDYAQLASYLEDQSDSPATVIFTLAYERNGLDYEFRDGTDLEATPPFGPYFEFDYDTSVIASEASTPTVWVIDSADSGLIWSDNQRAAEEFSFDETVAALPARYELVDEVILSRFAIRRYDES